MTFPILKENVSTFSIILLCLNLIIYKVSSRDFSFIKRYILLLTIPFWIILFTSFFSNNLEISFIHIQHALFFLLVPITFSLIPKEFFTLKKVNLYISFLKNICVIITIIYIVSYFQSITLWKFKLGYYEYSDFRDFVYNEFKVFKIHPSYFTSILILCTAHSYDLVLKQKKYFHLIYAFVFMIITFLLLTRLNIIVFVSVLFLMTFFRTSLKPSSRIAFGLSFLVIAALLIVHVPGISIRFKETINSFNVKPKDLDYDSTNIRKAILDCDLSLVKENWKTGIGYENLQNSLNDCYKSNYKSSFYLHDNYMTHNYYLYIFICSGFLGFILYLFYLYNLVRICVKKNIFLLNVLVISTLIICFVEDYLYRQYGLLYFNLLLMIFIKYDENKKLNTTENGI